MIKKVIAILTFEEHEMKTKRYMTLPIKENVITMKYTKIE